MRRDTWLMLCVLLFHSLTGHASNAVQRYFDKIKHNPTALHQFLYEMPKGGELHYHFSGGVYPEVMLSYAQHSTYCIDTQTMTLLKPRPSCVGKSSSRLTAEDPWYRKLLDAWSMKDFHGGKESGHDHFFSTFSKFHEVFSDNPGLFLAAIMRRASAQHERYLEVMYLPRDLPSGPLVDAPLKVSELAQRYEALIHSPRFQAKLKHVDLEIKAIKARAKRHLKCHTHPNQPVCKLEVKFQCYALREQPLQQVFAQALQGFILAHDSSEVVGVNLVQAEDGPISLRDYKKQMAVFGFLHRHYPDVHISLHAGELSKDLGRPEDHQSHIHDAIFEGKADRIGHGVDIELEQDHEALMHYMAKRALPVEVNLSSNAEILNVKGRFHPLKQYLKHHVPVVLSTDDEGILRTSLTHEYQLAVQEHGLDYNTLKQLSRNALTYSFLPGASLWRRDHERVPACSDLNSHACLAYVSQSSKAKLQRDLELDFMVFEKRFSRDEHRTGQKHH